MLPPSEAVFVGATVVSVPDKIPESVPLMHTTATKVANAISIMQRNALAPESDDFFFLLRLAAVVGFR